jgi:hypothetical protein
MSLVKLSVSQSLSKLSVVGRNAIVSARPRMSDPPYSDARILVTLEQRLEFLDEDIEYLKKLIVELVAEGASEEEQLEYAAELRTERDARDEIVYLMREVSRSRITGPQPRDYEEWIPWAYEQLHPRPPQTTPEPEYDWSDWVRWAKSKRTLVRVPLHARNTEHPLPVARHPSRTPAKPRRRFWSLKIALRRFWVAISVTRSR